VRRCRDMEGLVAADDSTDDEEILE